MRIISVAFLILIAPFLMSVKAQSWAAIEAFTWVPSGDVHFQTSEKNDSDVMSVNLMWHKPDPSDIQDDTFDRYNAYEFNVSIMGSAKQVYKSCISRSKHPQFYDDCGTVGIDEHKNSLAFAFGFHNPKKIRRGTTVSAVMVFEKHPYELRNKKRSEEVPMSLYSEALNCNLTFVLGVWGCGLNPEDRASVHHAWQSDLYQSRVSIYGIGGKYYWRGPKSVASW